MTSTATADAAREALESIREGLAADGYELVVGDATGARLDVEIRAGEGACEECLVPKELMASMIVDSLPESLGVADVQLTYPTD